MRMGTSRMARIVDREFVVSEVRRGRFGRATGVLRTLVALAANLLVLAVLATPALAAAATAPEAGGTLDLQTWPDSGQLIVVTAVTVPDSVKLPTTVRVPVPAGATVQWAGEILGGELSADPERTYKMINSPTGGRYAEFTIEQTHTAQVDAAMPALTVAGDKTSAAFEWIQSVASPYTSFSVRVPGNASDVQISPKPSGPPEANSAGEQLYSGSPLQLKPGKKQAVTFSYSTAANVAPAAGSAGGLNTLVLVLVAALVVAVIALFVVLSRQKQGGSTPPPTPKSQRTQPPRPAAPVQPAEKSGTASDDDWGFDDSE